MKAKKAGPVAIPKSLSFVEQVSVIDNEGWDVPRLAMLSAELPVFSAPLAVLNLGRTIYEENMRGMVMHMKAVLDADMSKPIILSEDGEILDGRHRIMRALLEGHKTIKAVRFDENPEPCRTYESDDV